MDVIRNSEARTTPLIDDHEAADAPRDEANAGGELSVVRGGRRQDDDERAVAGSAGRPVREHPAARAVGGGAVLQAANVHNVVQCDPSMWEALERHLRGSEVEEAAVLYARVARRDNGITLEGVEYECFQPADFAYQSDVHIELSDVAQHRMIKRAWSLDCSIVELHSHVSAWYPPSFSGSDLSGFAEFVPHVWWRLRGRPYAAIVMAPHGIDALVWRTDPHLPEPLRRVERGALPPVMPTGASLAWLSSPLDPDSTEASGRVGMSSLGRMRPSPPPSRRTGGEA